MPKLDPERHILGLDFGLKHIGVAIGQCLTCSATAITSIPAQQGIPQWQALDNVLQQYDVQAIVVGIPLSMAGEDLSVTEQAREFCKQIEAHTNLPVYQCDERLSTKSAREELFNQGGFKALRKPNIDSTSAKIILEQWLRSQ